MKRRIVGIIALMIAIILTAVSITVSAMSAAPNSDEMTERTEIQQTQQSQETEETTITEGSTPDESTEPTDQSEAIETPIPEETEEDPWVTQNRVIPDVIPEFDETAYQVLSPQEALEQRGFFYTYTPEYRDIYHWIPKGLSEAANISYEEIDQWREETVIPNKINNVEPQEMYTVSFIKHFPKYYVPYIRELNNSNYSKEHKKNNNQAINNIFPSCVSLDEYVSRYNPCKHNISSS